jgi:hypothetical protein
VSKPSVNQPAIGPKGSTMRARAADSCGWCPCEIEPPAVVEFSRISLVPQVLYVLAAVAAAVAAVAWWGLSLSALQGCQLLASLQGTAFLASAFGPHPDVGERARLEHPNSVLRRLWWSTAHTANFAAVVYYPLPFYVGLALLAAAVLAVWPATR